MNRRNFIASAACAVFAIPVKADESGIGECLTDERFSKIRKSYLSLTKNPTLDFPPYVAQMYDGREGVIDMLDRIFEKIEKSYAECRYYEAGGALGSIYTVLAFQSNVPKSNEDLISLTNAVTELQSYPAPKPVGPVLKEPY